ncbi:MAG: Asp23/Gls24 family envelope stress response protein [Thermoleophilia bacterium]|nr:Asp23/Gls24 family envelope stress response protein [Thermoleophilia bacterium]
MSHQGLVVAGPLGRIELTGPALASLVTRSAEAVDGVHLRSRRRLNVVVDGSAIRVEIGVEAAVGTQLSDVGESVQHSVASAVTATTGLPTQVDVTFEVIA